MEINFSGPVEDQDDPQVTWGIYVLCNNPKCWVVHFAVGGKGYANARMNLNRGLVSKQRQYEREQANALKPKAMKRV
jgi:hypothetical protein